MPLSTLSTQQFAQLSSYVVMMRGLSATLMKTMNQMNALSNEYNSTIVTILTSSTGGLGVSSTPISDNSGLAGISVLTDVDVVNISFLMQSILGSWYDTNHQELLTRSAGPGNTF